MSGFKFPPPPPPPPKAAPTYDQAQRGQHNFRGNSRGAPRGRNGRAGYSSSGSRGGPSRGGSHGNRPEFNNNSVSRGRGGHAPQSQYVNSSQHHQSSHGNGMAQFSQMQQQSGITQPQWAPYSMPQMFNLGMGQPPASTAPNLMPYGQSGVNMLGNGYAFSPPPVANYMSPNHFGANGNGYGHSLPSFAQSNGQQSPPYQNHGAQSFRGNKRKRDELVRSQIPKKDLVRKPAVETAPAIPSFGITLPSSGSTTVPADAKNAGERVSNAQKRKRRKKTNQLGLTPQGEDAEVSEDDEDEESKFPFTGVLQFEHKGKIRVLDTPEKLRAWIETRRQNWPTKAKVEEKKKELSKRKAERAEARKKLDEARKEEAQKKVERERASARSRLEENQARRKARKQKQTGESAANEMMIEPEQAGEDDTTQKQIEQHLAEIEKLKKKLGVKSSVDTGDVKNVADNKQEAGKIAELEHSMPTLGNADSTKVKPKDPKERTESEKTDGGLPLLGDFYDSTSSDADSNSGDEARSESSSSSNASSSSGDGDSDSEVSSSSSSSDEEPEELSTREEFHNDLEKQTSKDSASLEERQVKQGARDTTSLDEATNKQRMIDTKTKDERANPAKPKPLCHRYQQDQQCPWGENCRYRHEAPSQNQRKKSEAGNVERKGIFARLVEQEQMSENRLAIEAIKALAEHGML